MYMIRGVHRYEYGATFRIKRKLDTIIVPAPILSTALHVIFCWNIITFPVRNEATTAGPYPTGQQL